MEINDLMTIKALEKENMTPYEQFKTQHIQAKSHTSGVAVAGLVTGVVGVVAGVTAWIFSPSYTNAKAGQAKEAANSAKEVAMAYISGIDKRLDNIGALLESEVTRRIEGDRTLSISINDTVSGQQQGQLTATQQAELSAINTATQTVAAGLMTGQYSQNPIKVVRVSGQRECDCDTCNGCR